jgi:hypothetical protein
MHSRLIIPARFLSLIAHLVIIIVLFWSKDTIINNCTSSNVNEESLSSQKNTELIVGFTFSLFLLTCELFGHLSGLSMFVDLPGLLSTFLHVSASVCLCLYWTLMWQCDTFWYIFAFGSVVPFFSEVVTILAVIRLRL